jgi:hypothetical protein
MTNRAGNDSGLRVVQDSMARVVAELLSAKPAISDGTKSG